MSSLGLGLVCLGLVALLLVARIASVLRRRRRKVPRKDIYPMW